MSSQTNDQKIELIRKLKYGEDFDRLEKTKSSEISQNFADEAAVREILAKEAIISREFQNQSQKRLHELRFFPTKILIIFLFLKNLSFDSKIKGSTFF